MNDGLADVLRVLIIRELKALDREIAAYPDDESVWRTPPGISNSTGTLALHMAGNLRHFIGAVIGKTGYVRNRDAEFSTRGLSRNELLSVVTDAIGDVERGLDALPDLWMNEVYPLPIQERRVRTAQFLVHLSVHLGYHLGQVDYHRRLVTQSGETVDTISVKELPGVQVMRGSIE